MTVPHTQYMKRHGKAATVTRLRLDESLDPILDEGLHVLGRIIARHLISARTASGNSKGSRIDSNAAVKKYHEGVP
jgi:hypothetical protein